MSRHAIHRQTRIKHVSAYTPKELAMLDFLKGTYSPREVTEHFYPAEIYRQRIATTTAALCRLEREQLIQRDSLGYYRLTEDGKAVLATR